MPRGNPNPRTDQLTNIAARPDFMELSRRGGQRSGEVRRRRKLLRETLIEKLSDGDTQSRLCDAIIAEAEAGNAAAFGTIARVLGEGSANLNVTHEIADLITKREIDQLDDKTADQLAIAMLSGENRKAFSLEASTALAERLLSQSLEKGE